MRRSFRCAAWMLALCTLTLGFVSCDGVKDSLRQFFKDNNRLVLVNPFPESLPMGLIIRREQGELLEIDRQCFAEFQDELIQPRPYDFIAVKTDKRRGISTKFLSRLANIDLARSETVSIEVLDAKRSIVGESVFEDIIGDPSFPTRCSEFVWDKRNYIVHDIVTGRLSFTFWRKISGGWEINIDIAVSETEGEEASLFGLWTTTQEGRIEMKEPRVLAVHARKWKRGSRGEYGERMSFFQFNRIWKLDWKFAKP